MTTLREAAQQALEAWDTRAGIDTASRAFEALRAALVEPVQEPQCNPHPKAPHGFLRNASHNEHRYVCECEGWEPYEAGYQAGMEAALAEPVQEPVQEPVAWIQPNHLQKARRAPFLCRVEPTKRMVDFVALYTAPPQRKPLTEEEIRNAISTFKAAEALMGVNHVHVARAIERAHGIKDA